MVTGTVGATTSGWSFVTVTTTASLFGDGDDYAVLFNISFSFKSVGTDKVSF